MTASGNVSKNLSWSGLKNHHLKHDSKQKHENQFLNTEKSKELQKFNTHFQNKRSFKFLVEKYFGNYMYDHDIHTKGYQWETIENFVSFDTKGKPRRNKLDFVFMEKFSDKKTWDAFKKKYEKKWEKLNPEAQKNWESKGITSGTDFASYKAGKAVKRYMKGFSERNPDITFIEGYSHVDELGAPHAHMRLMATPDRERTFTKSGVVKKPSTSLNKALRKQFPDAENNKQALSMWRQQEDTAMVEAFKAELNFNLELYRKKSKVTGLNHGEYVKYKQEKDDLSKKWDNLITQKHNFAEAVHEFSQNMDKDAEIFKQGVADSAENSQKIALMAVSMYAKDRQRQGSYKKSDRQALYSFLTNFLMLKPSDTMTLLDAVDERSSLDEVFGDKQKENQKDDEFEL